MFTDPSQVWRQHSLHQQCAACGFVVRYSSCAKITYKTYTRNQINDGADVCAHNGLGGAQAFADFYSV